MEQMGDWEKNHELIDSFIEEAKGSKQCTKSHEVLNNFNFTKILVSPMRRTIQTAIKILENHPIMTSG